LSATTFRSILDVERMIVGLYTVTQQHKPPGWSEQRHWLTGPDACVHLSKVNAQERDLPEAWPRTHVTRSSRNVPISQTPTPAHQQTCSHISSRNISSPHQFHQRNQGSNPLHDLCLDFGSGGGCADGVNGIERLTLVVTASARFVLQGALPSEAGRGEFKVSEFFCCLHWCLQWPEQVATHRLGFFFSCGCLELTAVRFLLALDLDLTGDPSRDGPPGTGGRLSNKADCALSCS